MLRSESSASNKISESSEMMLTLFRAQPVKINFGGNDFGLTSDTIGCLSCALSKRATD